ncbi:MAG TPA: arginase family protein [Solirubrobacterales bacterium]|nr:arginase family protein [Solirubrobacterales bacterium]
MPVDSVGRSGGTEHAPAALRELGLVDVLGGGDAGDLDVRIRGEQRDPETGIVASADVLATTSTLRGAVAELVRRGERPFLAGGCCSEVPGALAGARDAVGRVGLAYLDGHLDLYDGHTSPTGEAADMPISVALGLGPAAWVDAAGGASLAPADAALVGHRDQEESRAYGMTQPGELGEDVVSLSVDDVRGEGPAAVGGRVAEALGAKPMWLHFDVDVLDQEVFPATDYLLPNGMSWEELMPMMAPLASSESLVGFSLGCYNPEKDPDRACGRALVDALARALDG